MISPLLYGEAVPERRRRLISLLARLCREKQAQEAPLPGGMPPAGRMPEKRTEKAAENPEKEESVFFEG